MVIWFRLDLNSFIVPIIIYTSNIDRSISSSYNITNLNITNLNITKLNSYLYNYNR